MATACSNELEDFITCAICLIEYDSVNRKPKFLQCSHTICLICVQRIVSNGVILCPFCRHIAKDNNAETLPNNMFALQLLKFKGNEKLSSDITQSTGDLVLHSLCIQCGKTKKPSCAASEHAFFMTTEESIKSIEALNDIDKELVMINKLSPDKLELAVEKYIEVQGQLNGILKTIKTAGDKIKQLQDGNDLLLEEVISNLEKNSLPEIDCLPTRTRKNEKYPVELHPIGIALLNNKLEDLIFVVKLFNMLGVRIAEFHFRPASSFRFPKFVQQLAQFCYQSPKQFDRPIKKAVPDTFVLFRMSHQSFNVNVPCAFPGANAKVLVEASPGVIGVFWGKNFNDDYFATTTVTDWNLLFPLSNFQHPKRQQFVSQVSNAELFGRVVYNEISGSITNLSHSKNSDRTYYSLTLESRYVSK